MPGSPRHFLSKVILDLYSYVILNIIKAHECSPLVILDRAKRRRGSKEEVTRRSRHSCASVMLVCKHPITTLGFLYMESAAQIHNWRLGYEQASLLTTLGFCILSAYGK
jgi:hypothetical protein